MRNRFSLRPSQRRGVGRGAHDRSQMARPNSLAKEEDYLDLMRENALPDYRSTEGNLGAWVLHRREGDIVHIETLTLWEDEAAIRRFMGEDMERA